MDNGVFVVRFQKIESKEVVLQSEYYMFENKPLIIKPWDVNVDLVKEKGDCLPQIAGLVGKYVQRDKATLERTRLSFARVMVELGMDQNLPDRVKFLDEHGKGIRHESKKCRKARPRTMPKKVQQQPQPKKVWRSVQKEVLTSLMVEQSAMFTPDVFPPLHQVIQSTPARQLMRLNRQGGTVGLRNMGGTGPYTFIEALNNNDVDLFGMLETKIKPSTLLNKNNSLCEGWSVSTNSSWHKGGRIWILCKLDFFTVQFLSYGAQYIHIRVQSRDDGKKFLMTMIYAFNGVVERQGLWDFLKQEAVHCNEPWIWTGDFNTVLNPVERLGGHTTEIEMEQFQECVSLCCMEDIQATGALFTWSDKQEPVDRVYSILDRVMGNFEWMEEYGDYTAHFHPEGLFDHCPSTIVDRKVGLIGRRNFKYFNMWGQADSFKDCVRKVWQGNMRGTKMFQLIKKLKDLKPVLKQMNKTCFSYIENSYKLTGVLLESIKKELLDKPGDMELMQKEHVVAQELRGL
ncbi:uncharacterized protein LOC141595431 [Silene latifolia]|uniref:uncharacterized protein LOC141595431 n=1 Tax=Silene latifolia TaxID=37657 RepID=UPI003D76D8D3